MKKGLSLFLAVAMILTSCFSSALVIAAEDSPKKIINIPFSSFDTATDGMSTTVSGSYLADTWNPTSASTHIAWLESGAMEIFNSTNATAGSEFVGHGFKNNFPTSGPYKVVGKLNMSPKAGGGYQFRLVNSSGGSVIAFAQFTRTDSTNNIYRLDIANDGASGASSLKTAVKNIAQNTIMNVLFVLDVTDTNGTNTLTYYINGQKFSSSLAPSVITAGHNRVRFQNGNNATGVIDNIGMYSVMSDDLPAFVIEDSKVDGDVYITFSNEIAVEKFTDPSDSSLSLITATPNGGTSYKVPVSALNVENDNLTLRISASAIGTKNLTLDFADTATDVLGTILTGTTQISVVPEKRIINLPFTGFDTENDSISYSGDNSTTGSSAYWYPNVAAASSIQYLNEGAVKIFTSPAVSGNLQFARNLVNLYPEMEKAPYKIVGKLNMKMNEGSGVFFRMIKENRTSSVTLFEMTRTSQNPSVYRASGLAQGAAAFNNTAEIVSGIAQDEWVNALFVIDVTESDGTNTVTYYVNDQKFVTSLDKSIVTARNPYVRFQNGTDSIATIDNIGMYTVISDNLPEFTARYNGPSIVDITNSEGIKIDFSNEIAKVNFANPTDETLSVFKLTRSNSEEITVPMDKLSVSADNMSIIISGDVLTNNSNYELVMTHKIKDVLGQEISGNTTFNFATPRKEIVVNVPYTSFTNGDGYSSKVGVVSSAWAPWNSGTVNTFNADKNNVTLFSPDNATAGGEQFGTALTNNFPSASDVPYTIVGKVTLSLDAGKAAYYRLINSSGSSVAPIVQAVCSNDEGRVYIQIPRSGCATFDQVQNIADMDKSVNHVKTYGDMVEVLYTIDVTDSSGTNKVTYYIDGTKFETSYDPRVILNTAVTRVRFQNGNNSQATIDDIGIYSVIGSKPDFTASIDSTVIDPLTEDVVVKFSTEVYEENLKSSSNSDNSIFTIKADGMEDYVVPMSDITVLGDFVSVNISAGSLQALVDYTLCIDSSLKNVMGTTITGNTQLSFRTISTAPIYSAQISATSSAKGHDASLTIDRYQDTYWMSEVSQACSIEYALDEAVSFNAATLNFLETVPSYKIYTKADDSSEYVLTVNSENNIKSGIVKESFETVSAKYIKIEFLSCRLPGSSIVTNAVLSDFSILTQSIDTSNTVLQNPAAKKISYNLKGENTSSGDFGKYVLNYSLSDDVSIPFALKNETADGYNVSDANITFTSLPSGVTYENSRLIISKDTADMSEAVYTDGTETGTIVFTRNLALFKPVYESSNSSVGSNAVDGTAETSWISEVKTNATTDSDMFQYITVDLGYETNINKVKFNHNITDGSAYKINTFSILVSNDNENFEIVKPTEFASGNNGETVFLFGDVSARYIKYSAVLKSDKEQYAQLNDIAVYETKADSISINAPMSVVLSDGEGVLLSATVTDSEGDVTTTNNAPTYSVDSEFASIIGRELKISPECTDAVVNVTAAFGGNRALKQIKINQIPSVVNFKFNKDTLADGSLTASVGVRSLNTASSKELALVIARYDLSGNMIDVNSTSITPSVSENYTDYTVTLENIENVASSDYAKAFVVDAQTLAPLLGAIGLGNCDDARVQNEKNVNVTEFYLCIGQSNMAGYQNKIPEEYNFDGVPIPSGIYLWNKSSEFVEATHPYAQYSTAASYDGTSKQTANSQINMVYSFSLDMREDMPSYNRLGFIVNPRSGSAIQQWSKGNTEYNFYAEAVRHCTEAMEQGAVLKGILWHQGESNRTDKTYLQQLYTLVNNLRTDLNAPDVPFVLGEVNVRTDVSYENSVYFNNHIAIAPEMIPNCAVASAKGCVTPDADTSHFNRASQILLGHRYFNQMKKIMTK